MTSGEPRKKYCSGCGRDVNVYVMLARGGAEQDRCEICNAVLDDSPELSSRIEPLPNVMVVEDTALLREIISDIMKGKRLARNVISLKNGYEFIRAFSELAKNNQTAGMVVLDVNMPIINGINAAISIRAVEQGFGLSKKAPILFFTVKECDEQFRKVLKFCTPALYINKGRAATPLEMQERVEKVVSQLLKEREQGGAIL